MPHKDPKVRLFVELPVPKAVISLSIPTVFSSLVALLYSLADTFFVGLLNDPVQTGAVTLASSVILALTAVTNLFGVGSSSMMSRALGRGDLKTLRESSAFGFYGALICGLLYSVACLLFLNPLLTLLGANATTAVPTSRYLLWTICIGATPSILNVVVAYFIRSEGATLHASIATMSGCVLNIILDPLFILPQGLNMGAEGAAIATLISNCVALSYAFGYLFFKRKTTCVCISPRFFTLRREVVGGVCTVGIPAAIQNLLNVTSRVLLNNAAAAYGAAALAGMGIATKIAMVPWYISNGISQGVMPLIGYNYASRNIPRMKHALRFTVKLTEAILCLTTLFCCLCAPSIIRAFIEDPQSVAYGSSFLYGLSLSVPLIALDFLAVGVFQAVGKGSLSLFMAICRKVVLEIPALYLLNMIWPLYGLSCAQLVAEIGMAAIGSVLLIRLVKQIEKSQPAC